MQKILILTFATFSGPKSCNPAMRFEQNLLIRIIQGPAKGGIFRLSYFGKIHKTKYSVFSVYTEYIVSKLNFYFWEILVLTQIFDYKFGMQGPSIICHIVYIANHSFIICGFELLTILGLKNHKYREKTSVFIFRVQIGVWFLICERGHSNNTWHSKGGRGLRQCHQLTQGGGQPKCHMSFVIFSSILK